MLYSFHIYCSEETAIIEHSVQIKKRHLRTRNMVSYFVEVLSFLTPNSSVYRMKKIFNFSYYSIIILFATGYAQSSAYANNLKENTKIWTSIKSVVPISANKRWSYFIEPQLRFIDDKYKFNQINLYLGLKYQTSDDLSLWAGIYRRYEQKPNGSTENQYRLWQQAVWQVIGNEQMKLSSRTRLEERKNTQYSQLSYRLREKLGIKSPISNWSQHYLVISDEVFFQLNRPQWVSNRFFSENRAFIGFDIPINNKYSYVIGYLNEFQFKNPNEMSNILYLQLNMQ